jgi:phosphoesterase RecJ-like protein
MSVSLDRPDFGEDLVHDWDLSTFERARTVVLTTHVHPDGDGLGSALALKRGLERLGKDVRILLQDVMPVRYRFMDHAGAIEVADLSLASWIRDADLFAVLDTNDVHRVGTPFAMRAGQPVCVIDHHQGVPSEGTHLICDPDASSTGEIIYRILKKLGVEIDVTIAEPIYASILYDTGSFRYIRNRAQTLRVAAELLEAGVDAAHLQENIFSNKPKDLPLLLGRAMKAMKYEASDRIAWTIVPEEMVADLDLDPEALRELISFMISLEGVMVAVVLKQRDASTYKLSVRSKEDVDIFPVAQSRGGGGHIHAAGATIQGEPQTLIAEIVSELKDIMSD